MQNFRSSEQIISQLKEKRGSSEQSKNQDPQLTKNNPPMHHFAVIVIQSLDVKKTTNALGDLGLLVIQLPSTGAFLREQNVTLLIGLAEGQEEAMLEAIEEVCCQRQAYVTAPMEGAPLPVPVATPVTVGGATIFTIEVEQFEEF
jgi:uncharacterized protein YaaQ